MCDQEYDKAYEAKLLYQGLALENITTRMKETYEDQARLIKHLIKYLNEYDPEQKMKRLEEKVEEMKKRQNNFGGRLWDDEERITDLENKVNTILNGRNNES